jgi:hypothetical protein
MGNNLPILDITYIQCAAYFWLQFLDACEEYAEYLFVERGLKPRKTSEKQSFVTYNSNILTFDDYIEVTKRYKMYDRNFKLREEGGIQWFEPTVKFSYEDVPEIVQKEYTPNKDSISYKNFIKLCSDDMLYIKRFMDKMKVLCELHADKWFKEHSMVPKYDSYTTEVKYGIRRVHIERRFSLGEESYERRVNVLYEDLQGNVDELIEKYRKEKLT